MKCNPCVRVRHVDVWRAGEDETGHHYVIVILVTGTEPPTLVDIGP